MKEEIPLELNIQNGKFDLLVPFYSVATRGAFTQIAVKDANGQVVEPKRALTQEHPQKYVKHHGKSVRCIHGFDFKADANQELTLKDIQRYYQLQPRYLHHNTGNRSGSLSRIYYRGSSRSA